MDMSKSTVRERVVPEGRTPGTKADFEPHVTLAPRLRLDARRGRWSLKRLLIAAAASLFLAVAASYGDYYWTTGRFLVSTDDAYVQAHSVLISPKVSGYISEVPVDDNQAVNAGQTLARIDDRDYLTALDAARANVAAAQAAVDKLEQQITQQRLVVEPQATVTTDQAALDFRSSNTGAIPASRAPAPHRAAGRSNGRPTTRERGHGAHDNAAVGAAQQQVDVLGPARPGQGHPRAATGDAASG